jgi:hypothetical protein
MFAGSDAKPELGRQFAFPSGAWEREEMVGSAHPTRLVARRWCGLDGLIFTEN